MIPVDYLDKMSDEKADLKTYCQSEAFKLIDPSNTQHLLIHSKPYIKKQNLTQDKAQWSAWQVQIRVDESFDVESSSHIGMASGGQAASAFTGAASDSFAARMRDGQAEISKSEKDYFVTAVRRKYIPPLMECFQDILVISEYNYEKSASPEDRTKDCRKFMREVH